MKCLGRGHIFAMNRSTRDEIRICHFSDLHLAPKRSVVPWKLLGKRALGYANLMLNRGRTHKEEHLVALLRKVTEEDADLVVVTGDFTSLSLGFEFQHIDALFKAHGLSPQRTVVIPGNHDRYTFLTDTFDAFEKGMADWMPAAFQRKAGYPIVRELGPVLFMALDTAVWRNPVRAAGAVSDDQLDRLKAALDGNQGRRWPVIALHHPPVYRGLEKLRHYRTGLDGYERLIAALEDRPATVIHGHLHESSRCRVGALDIIGVPSASNNTGDPHTQLAYYVYTFAAAGLTLAEAVRLWPDRAPPEAQVERYELPQEIGSP